MQAVNAPITPCLRGKCVIKRAIMRADTKNERLPSMVLLNSFSLPYRLPISAAIASEMIRNNMLVITICFSNKIVINVKDMSKNVELK